MFLTQIMSFYSSTFFCPHPKDFKIIKNNYGPFFPPCHLFTLTLAGFFCPPSTPYVGPADRPALGYLKGGTPWRCEAARRPAAPVRQPPRTVETQSRILSFNWFIKRVANAEAEWSDVKLSQGQLAFHIFLVDTKFKLRPLPNLSDILARWATFAPSKLVCTQLWSWPVPIPLPWRGMNLWSEIIYLGFFCLFSRNTILDGSLIFVCFWLKKATTKKRLWSDFDDANFV